MTVIGEPKATRQSMLSEAQPGILGPASEAPTAAD